MPIDFRSHRFTFPSRRGFAQTAEHTFDFPSDVKKAETFINGFNIGFTSSEHPVFREEVNTAVARLVEDTVTVRTVFALRDRSNYFDDAYDGFIDVVVVVDRA
jgi:DNA-binding transcriptional regulator YbjK